MTETLRDKIARAIKAAIDADREPKTDAELRAWKKRGPNLQAHLAEISADAALTALAVAGYVIVPKDVNAVIEGGARILAGKAWDANQPSEIGRKAYIECAWDSFTVSPRACFTAMISVDVAPLAAQGEGK